jgi:hypothetical protein
VEGNGLGARAAVKIRQFAAVGHGGGDRHGAPYQGPLVPVVRRCFRGCPPCIPTDRDIYIYIHSPCYWVEDGAQLWSLDIYFCRYGGCPSLGVNT